MSSKLKKIALDPEINPASILLVFKDSDALIARNWQKPQPDDLVDIRVAF